MKTAFKLLVIAGIAIVVPAVAGAAEANDNWTTHCKKCHAADGSGATPGGKALHVKDYTKAEVQAELKDPDMIKAIKEGVKSSAGKSLMPAYADKLADDEVASLVALIRTFKKG